MRAAPLASPPSAPRPNATRAASLTSRWRALALGAAAVGLLGGAEGGGCKADREVPVQAVRAGAQCGGDGEGFSVREIRSAEELRAAFPAQLGVERPSEGSADDVSAPDFERDLVLLVSAGQKPTAGHAVALARPTAPVKGRIAAVLVSVRRPEPGAMTAQMMTSPCLVVKLPREGLGEVKIADEGKNVLASAKVR